MKTKNFILFIVCIFFGFTLNAQTKTNTKTNRVLEDEPKPAIIEVLQNGESYSIEITSIGCFSGSRETLVISKETDIITVSFQDTTKILTEADIEAFKTFELQLRSLSMGGCTTVDTYVIRYGDEKFRTMDGTCSWLGGKKLLKAIS